MNVSTRAESNGKTFNRMRDIRGLLKGLHAEFDTFIPIGSKAAKMVKDDPTDVIFKTYSNGVKTNRDAWVYNFDQNTLIKNVDRMNETYNTEVARWTQRKDRNADLDNFVVSEDTQIKWSRDLKGEIRARNNVRIY